MRGFDKAGILFTDFSVAFPSMVCGLIFTALRVMGVPSAIVGFYVSLYSSSVAVANFAGAAERMFGVEQCVRLGDLPSVAFFALVLGPALR